jgi:hypothetical protein
MFYSQEAYDEYQADLAGDGFRNEYQRAYFVSRMNRPLKDEHALAARLHAAGRVVVCAEYEVCCPTTDGLIGYDWVVLKDFATREDALAYLGDGEDESCHIYTPEPPPAPAPQTPIEDDEIPF